MGTLQAGISKRIITPRVGAKLVGYFDRLEGSKGIHDDLCARAVVLDNGEIRVAICSLELLWLGTKQANSIREMVSQHCPIRPENILITCTHTHGGPAPHDSEVWDTPLDELIADTIVDAYESRQPAGIGFGFGQLFGYNINRRWLNRPADPSVGVMRVDQADGKPLAVVGNGAIALFTLGGAGDVNPLTETVRQRLAAGHPVGTIGNLTSYYGKYQHNDPSTWNIEDRAGGTFLECETLARAYNAEVSRVWRAIQTESNPSIWTERTIVNGAAKPDEPRGGALPPEYRAYIPEMLLGIGAAVLATQPGEVFSETAINLRKTGQQMGYSFPWLVSYANGSFAYLPPANAFDEGGYEVEWALRIGLSRHMQDWINEAIMPILERHKPDKTNQF